ncbi:hypothetical protein [Streptomyces sp. NPDC086182]|uniref:hypothetical protein n=1 Tax=Streptomyces sp. NPDC086182 TaxID=3155058 RepID=UPI00341667EC
MNTLSHLHPVEQVGHQRNTHHPHQNAAGDGMHRQQILDLYEWAAGICFRHPDQGEIATAHVKTVHPRAGHDEELRACKACILQMEQERWAAASSDGIEYTPGRVGEALP